jgi:gamma-glutamyltranspeptidase/glutathione hydrolase
MNDEMDDFTTAPGEGNLFGLVTGKANEIAPGKRPLSSMSPTIVRDAKGETRLVMGSMGGPRIITSVFQALLFRLRFGLSLYDAVLAARVHEQWKPATLYLEKFGFAPEVRARLSAMGWDLKETTMSQADGAINQMHCLERFPDGRVWGAPDARAEGAAVAQ